MSGFTRLQHRSFRRWQQSRDMAWQDGNARQVGRMDAKLGRGENPYEAGSDQGAEWREGYAEIRLPQLDRERAQWQGGEA